MVLPFSLTQILKTGHTFKYGKPSSTANNEQQNLSVLLTIFKEELSTPNLFFYILQYDIDFRNYILLVVIFSFKHIPEKEIIDVSL